MPSSIDLASENFRPGLPVAHPNVQKMPIIRMNAAFKQMQPGALSRQILALSGRLETLAVAKKPAPVKPAVNYAWNA